MTKIDDNNLNVEQQTSEPKPIAEVTSIEPQPEAQVYATFEDFIKIKMVVGLVTQVEAHPKSKKLLVLQVSFGQEGQVTILTGLQAYYPNFAEYFANKKFIFVKNLAPRPMAGMVSQGMLLSTMSSGTPIPVLAPEGAMEGDGLS